MMDEVAVRADSLDSRATAARQSKEEAESILEEFTPFLNACVARYCPREDVHRRDELFSVAMTALYEAIQKYEDQKGHFFPFAKRVVSLRIVDFIRQIYKHKGRTVPLEGDDGSQDVAHAAAMNKLSLLSYKAQQRQEMLAHEIEQFKAELAHWGITLDVLSKQSPKHRKVRDTYRILIQKVSHDLDIVQTIQLKRYYPVKAIAELTGLPHKMVERARTFTLATLIIKLGDYEYMSEYVGG